MRLFGVADFFKGFRGILSGDFNEDLLATSAETKIRVVLPETPRMES